MTERTYSNTRHILYIATNARYNSEFGDAAEFNKTLDIFKKLPSLSPLGLQGESYKNDYIVGMYPEFDGAIEYFRNKVYPDPNNKKVLPGILLKKYADETIKKFGLKDSYDFSQEPNAEQLARLNTSMIPKQIKDMNNLAPEFLKQMGVALAETSKDFRVVHEFMGCFNQMEAVLSGRISKEHAREFTDIKGVKMGLDFSELVDQRIIDEDLNILDAARLSQFPKIKEFTFVGKSYDLSRAFQKKSEFIERKHEEIRI